MKVSKVISVTSIFVLACKASPLEIDVLSQEKHYLNYDPSDEYADNFFSIVDSYNAPPCSDQTQDIFSAILSYKFNLGIVEKQFTTAITGFRRKLHGKDEFSMIDLFEITLNQLKSFNVNHFNVSDILLHQRLSEIKTFYSTTPLLQHCVSFGTSLVQNSLTNIEWNNLLKEGKEFSTKFFLANPILGSIYQESSRLANSNETRLLLHKIKTRWIEATPICAMDDYDAISVHVLLSEIPSRAMDVQDPKPGAAPDYSSVELENYTALERTTNNILDEYTNQTTNSSSSLTFTNTDESAGIASYRFSSWSIMGAVVVALSSVLFF